MKGALIDATKPEQSKWRNIIDEIADEYHVKQILHITKMNIFKTLMQKEIKEKINENIENEAVAKTKVKHLRELRQDAKLCITPEYMDQLTRKQCNTILKTRASMIMDQVNNKKGNDNDLNCRFCRMEPETQGNILQENPEIGNTIGKCKYESIFKDEINFLKDSPSK